MSREQCIGFGDMKFKCTNGTSGLCERCESLKRKSLEYKIENAPLAYAVKSRLTKEFTSIHSEDFNEKQLRVLWSEGKDLVKVKLLEVEG